MNQLTVRIHSKKENLKACIGALEPEIDPEILRRSRIKMERSGNTLELCFETDDLTAMRACMNTYLRWTDMCLSITQIDSQ